MDGAIAGGGWKLLHHMARRFFSPVTVVAIPDADGFRLIAINDTAETVDFGADISAVSTDGRSRALAVVHDGFGGYIDVGPDLPVELCRIAAFDLEAGEILVWYWYTTSGVTGHDHALTGCYKALDLRDPGIALDCRVEGSDVVARVTAKALALFVTLEADRPGRFSDNAITLYPWRKNTEIRFTPADGDPAAVRLTVRDLWSSAQTSARSPTRGTAP